MGLPSGARAMADRFNRDRPDRQRNDDPDRDKDERPRPRGFLGNDGDDPPTSTPGLLAGIEDVLATTDGPAGGGRDREIERRDERPLRPAPAEEEEVIIPGDPNDLGERGRRRRQEDDRDASPVLRRGLLGV